MMRSVGSFKNFSNLLVASSFGLPAVKPTSIPPDFSYNKGIITDLQNCYSDGDLFTAPWCFFSSFIIFLFLSKVQEYQKSNKLVPSIYFVMQKLLLAHVT